MQEARIPTGTGGPRKDETHAVGYPPLHWRPSQYTAFTGCRALSFQASWYCPLSIVQRAIAQLRGMQCGHGRGLKLAMWTHFGCVIVQALHKRNGCTYAHIGEYCTSAEECILDNCAIKCCELTVTDTNVRLPGVVFTCLTFQLDNNTILYF